MAITAGIGAAGPTGSILAWEGDTWYRIAHIDRMPPFLMNVPSDCDVWLFVASNGGLTAGRRDADGALFPYETADRIYDGPAHTGPVTLIRVGHGEDARIWQPFSPLALEDDRIERRLYKNLACNRVVFEEIHHDHGLEFRYRWSACDRFGLVRTAWLTRRGGSHVDVEVLDGVRNVLPFGVPLALLQQRSSLVDAYKSTECDPETGLAIFSLTAKITDRAEAVEELRANTAWCCGLGRPTLLLSDDAIAAFRRGEPLAAETLRTGVRGHFFANASLRLAPGAAASWHIALDAGLGPTQVVVLRERLRAGGSLAGEMEAALDRATAELVRNVASADGQHLTRRAEVSMHHFANVLFNNMRGGVFANGYQAPVADVIVFLRTRNQTVAAHHAGLLDALPGEVGYAELLAAARRTGDLDFERLVHEYLPLHFSRRHGDPSRPWNRFSIAPRHPDGSPAFTYEGNWRDIFQNWEALAFSFPHFLPGMIAKFVNASTVDGFNPYRLTREGVDWEVVDPADPWSHIGYWGDHQVVYLLRLLEALHGFAPESLAGLLDRPVFSYANVPYRLVPYATMLTDPHATIEFDPGLAVRIEERVRTLGTDGKLVADGHGTIHHTTLIEKLLVCALARLSNFVPDGGIWMNTQRPEWNDANNALAGNGVSTVTLCHLRRYLDFVARRLAERGPAPIALAPEVGEWMRQVIAVLRRRPPAPGTARSDRERKTMLDALGNAFSAYRARVYAAGFSASRKVAAEQAATLCRVALEHVDHTIALNRRPDGLYHSYHVLGPTNRDTLEIHPLYEMLEGQVAVLSSGAISSGEAAGLLESLFASRMYDQDRASFLLYPERELPGFLAKNTAPAAHVRSIGLLRDLLDAGDSSIVEMDVTGICRFHPDLSQRRRLAEHLDAIAGREEWAARVEHDRQAVLDFYEEVFHHRAYTGRSGTMYGYEGLGCIYWHMVVKLMLAAQEQALRALEVDDLEAARSLVRNYHRIRAGLGFEKTPEAYGAFPTDPYSHTPRHSGAQQPGMTGQVKEEILARFGELGAGVRDGIAHFRPRLLRQSEFLAVPVRWRCVTLDGTQREIEVPRDALAFTWCGTPIVYQLTDGEPWVKYVPISGPAVTRSGDQLDAPTSRTLLGRTGEIERIEVGVPRQGLAPD